MDYADKLDFMDDDCDIQGFPIEEDVKNDIERAIEYLKDRKHSQITDWKVKSYDLAIQALEKQMPKKPFSRPYCEEEFDSGTDYICPNCKEMIVGSYTSDFKEWVYRVDYCSNCGQKIDWEA